MDINKDLYFLKIVLPLPGYVTMARIFSPYASVVSKQNGLITSAPLVLEDSFRYFI